MQRLKDSKDVTKETCNGQLIRTKKATNLLLRYEASQEKIGKSIAHKVKTRRIRAGVFLEAEMIVLSIKLKEKVNKTTIRNIELAR